MPSARFWMLDRSADGDPTTGAQQNDAVDTPRPVKFRGAGFTPGAGRTSGWIALVLVIAFWQFAGSAGWVNPLFLPAPSAIAVAIYKLAQSGALWQHLPLSILWLGIGEEPKIATIALGVFFSTAISVYSGVDAVPRNLIRMAQSFNVPFHLIVRRVIWPGALPSILAGFRITASVALLLVVSAEMIGAEFGIGAFVLQAGNLMQTDQLLAGVVILSLFGLAVGRLINLLETRLLHWR